MPGPAPKPTKLKELAGNPGKRALNKREPVPTEGIPTRPDWLAPEAKREWTRITHELVAMGLLAKADRAALANYCLWWSILVDAVRILKRDGLTFKMENTGYIQQRPEVAIAQKAAMLCKGFLTEFGLTPASRSRIAVPAREKADPLMEYLASPRVTELLRDSDEATEV